MLSRPARRECHPCIAVSFVILYCIDVEFKSGMEAEATEFVTNKRRKAENDIVVMDVKTSKLSVFKSKENWKRSELKWEVKDEFGYGVLKYCDGAVVKPDSNIVEPGLYMWVTN